MTTLSDIAQVILLMQAAFPNYHPEKGDASALAYQFLQDLPSDTEGGALATCAQAEARRFTPTVKRIRCGSAQTIVRALGIPTSSKRGPGGMQDAQG